MASLGSRGQSTRESILRVAANQFRADGYGASTLDDIARALGITRAAVLYHYNSKEEILEAVVSPYLARLSDLLSHYPVGADVSTMARRRLIVEFVDITVDCHLAAGILLRDVTSWELPRVRERSVACTTRFLDLISGPEPTTELRAMATCLLGALIRPLVDLGFDPHDAAVRGAVLDVTFAISARIDRIRHQPKGAEPSVAD